MMVEIKITITVNCGIFFLRPSFLLVNFFVIHSPIEMEGNLTGYRNDIKREEED